MLLQRVYPFLSLCVTILQFILMAMLLDKTLNVDYSIGFYSEQPGLIKGHHVMRFGLFASQFTH